MDGPYSYRPDFLSRERVSLAQASDFSKLWSFRGDPPAIPNSPQCARRRHPEKPTLSKGVGSLGRPGVAVGWSMLKRGPGRGDVESPPGPSSSPSSLLGTGQVAATRETNPLHVDLQPQAAEL